MAHTPPIQRRLMAMMLLTSAAVLVLTCAAFLIYERVASRRQMTAQLATLARVIASNSTAALAFRNPDDAREVLASLRTEPDIVAAALYDAKGAIFVTYPAAGIASFPDVAGDGYRFAAGYLHGFQPIAEQPEHRLGTLYLRSDLQSIYGRFWSYGTIAVLAVCAALLLAYLLSRYFHRSISGPILALAQTARAISERADFSVRAAPVGDAEFRQLTDGFNRMLERIDMQSTGLKHSEGRLRAVLNSSLSAVVVMDSQGVIRDWNARAEVIFGWQRNEALEQDLASLIIPERQRAAHHRGLERFFATGEGPVLGRTLELTALRRDGTEIPVEVEISVLESDGSRSFCGFVTDISERHQAKARLQAQLARLELLQRTTRAIGERQDLHSIFQVILRNLEDNLPIDFGCITHYDNAARALVVASIGVKSSGSAAQLGLSIGSALPIERNGLSRCVAGVLVYEPDLDEASAVFPQQLAGLGFRSMVAAPLAVENEIFGVLIGARAARGAFSSGECEFLRQLSEHVALAAHQVQLHSALQQAYDELRHSQHALLQQERLRALGEMASGIAHDINNAISPIALYTESLLTREPNLSPRTRDYLRVIQRSIGDVSQTVARMREFYRERDWEAELLPVELNGLAEQVIEMTRARWHDQAQERGADIEVRVELAADLPKVQGIESDVRDALTNLIFNAVDAMPTGGTLTLRTRTVPPPQLTDAPPDVELEVIDTGMGMDEETRRRCFEPFFTTKGARGTGLGLAMVYGMVKRHGARIEIDSTPGQGTTMRLHFAPAPTHVLPEVHRSAPVEPLRILRLLIIDDDPLVARSLTQVLSGEGHEVTVQDGGQAGIDAFVAALQGDAPFDVVITDLGMPYVDGRAVAGAIKARSATTPVLLLTGWGQRLLAEKSVPPNVDRVLSKPPSLQELRRALAEVVLDRLDTEGA